MTLLIDPPTWPAHGTHFSHLISTSSLQELHHFAQENHLSPKAFDLDHYDVPAHLYHTLIEAGATPVQGSELTRALITSGLRVPLKERPSKIRGTLLNHWQALLPQHMDLGQHLLDQWEESHRTYHNSAHLLEMLTTLKQLYQPDLPPQTVLLATWLHDIVYQAQPGHDEQASADFALDVLTPLTRTGDISSKDLDAIVHLILLTSRHETASHPGLTSNDIAHFLDADLAILAAPEPRYRRYREGVRQEYSRYSDQEFATGRRRILENFMGQDSIFSSPTGQTAYEKRARANLGRELSEINL